MHVCSGEALGVLLCPAVVPFYVQYFTKVKLSKVYICLLGILWTSVEYAWASWHGGLNVLANVMAVSYNL